MSTGQFASAAEAALEQLDTPSTLHHRPPAHDHRRQRGIRRPRPHLCTVARQSAISGGRIPSPGRFETPQALAHIRVRTVALRDVTKDDARRNAVVSLLSNLDGLTLPLATSWTLTFVQWRKKSPSLVCWSTAREACGAHPSLSYHPAAWPRNFGTTLSVTTDWRLGDNSLPAKVGIAYPLTAFLPSAALPSSTSFCPVTCTRWQPSAPRPSTFPPLAVRVIHKFRPPTALIRCRCLQMVALGRGGHRQRPSPILRPIPSPSASCRGKDGQS